MATDTRERLVERSAELFRRQGYVGTGVKQILAEAQAPFGSLYHHFPGGKTELAGEAIRRSGAWYGELFATIAGAAPDAPSGVRDFFAGAAETLVETDYADACPIATVALEVASTNEPLREATADVFAAWVAGGTAYFARAGLADDRARAMTVHMLAALEGAFVLSRALRSTEPLAAAGAAVVAALEGELESGN
ncbi:MAG TPA: TetR/AcrR family transcriptional regulator [Solirubrobacteraceae bacterium]